MSLDDDELARLLASARRADLPDPARLTRIKSRLLPDAGASAPHASATRIAAKSALALKVGARVVLATVLLGVVTFWQLHARHAVEPQRALPASTPAPADPPPSAAPEPALTEPVQGPVAEPPAPASSKPKPRSRPAARPVTAPDSKTQAPASTLQEEAALLRTASLAARAGHLAEARSALERFDRTYPNSQLKSERDRLARDLAAREVAH